MIIIMMEEIIIANDETEEARIVADVCAASIILSISPPFFRVGLEPSTG